MKGRRKVVRHLPPSCAGRIGLGGGRPGDYYYRRGAIQQAAESESENGGGLEPRAR